MKTLLRKQRDVLKDSKSGFKPLLGPTPGSLSRCCHSNLIDTWVVCCCHSRNMMVLIMSLILLLAAIGVLTAI